MRVLSAFGLCGLAWLLAATPAQAQGRFRLDAGPRPYDTLPPRALPAPFANKPYFGFLRPQPNGNEALFANVPRLIDVALYDNYFTPRTVTVTPGSTVRWMNLGGQLHTVMSVDSYFDSGALPRGAWFRVTFAWPGVYHYYCRLQGVLMSGTVVVVNGNED